MSRSFGVRSLTTSLADPDLPVRDLLEAGEHAQGGGLAAAGGADDDHELGILDDEVELVDGERPVVVDLRDLLERDLSHARSFQVRSRPVIVTCDVTQMWWREGVLYQIYPRSFADANGDGVGDLAGITAKLDYLEWLGVSGIWLNPVNPSPNVDWGYDVADYTDVHPDLGSLADVDRLVAEAGRRGIRVLLDLVPNHTSDQHPVVPGAARLLRLGGRGAEQLAGDLRWRIGLGARRGSRTLLPAQLREGAAGPRLVEP